MVLQLVCLGIYSFAWSGSALSVIVHLGLSENLCKGCSVNNTVIVQWIWWRIYTIIILSVLACFQSVWWVYWKYFSSILPWLVSNASFRICNSELYWCTISATTIKVCSYSEIIMQESKHQWEEKINGIKHVASWFLPFEDMPVFNFEYMISV